ncbi:MAG: hypothetical protein CSA50_00855, partial [Gammaproteobacteria bacterium]
MRQKSGVVKNISGQFQAVDKDGNIRILKVGDFIYEGDEVGSVYKLDGTLSDTIDLQEATDDNSSITVQNLFSSELSLIPQGGYRYFEARDMGNDEGSTSRLMLFSSQTEDSFHEDRGSAYVSSPATPLYQWRLSEPRNYQPDEKPETPEAPIAPVAPAQPEPEIGMERDPVAEPKPDPEPQQNHPPVITGGKNTGEMTEIADNQPGENRTQLTTTGTLDFDDLDPADNHSITVTPQDEGYIGTLTPTIDPDTNTINWTFTVDDAALDPLGEDDALTQTYTITLNDGNGGTTTENIVITVNGSNDTPVALPDTESVSKESPATTGNVLVNDSDVDGDSLTVTSVNGATPGTTITTEFGSITLNPDGSYTYTTNTDDPRVAGLNDGETLIDTITYTLTDGNGGTASTTLTIRIQGRTSDEPNEPPVIEADGISTGQVTEIEDNQPGENSKTHITTGSLSFTDADDTDTHTVSAVPKNDNYLGTFTPTVDPATNTIHWTFSVDDADLDSLGADDSLTQTYTLTLDDGHGGTVTRDVVVTIDGSNDAPEPEADTGTISANGPSIVSGNVLDNDKDREGDSLTVVSEIDGRPGTTKETEYGNISIQPDGTYRYTLNTNDPAIASLGDNETLTDTITYTVADGNGGISASTITITINGNNEAPVIDSNGDTIGEITEVADNQPGENITMHTATGSLHFTDANSSDTHSVTASAKDAGYLGTFTPVVDQANNEIDWAFSVNDADLDHLKEGETLTQTYTLTLDDGNGGTTSEDVVITIVGKNDAPDARPDSNRVSETQPGASGNVLNNDSDVDSDALTVTQVNGSNPGNSINTQYGTLTLNPDGSYNYTADTSIPAVSGLNDGQTLTDTITYTVADGNGGTATETLTITIDGYTPPVPPNHSPVINAGDTAGNVTEITDNASGENTTNRTTGGTLNFTDADGSDTHTVTAVPKVNGYLGNFTPGIDSTNGEINWNFTVPDADLDHLKEGETLAQVYTITIDDGNGGTASKDVTVTLAGKNDAPAAQPDTGSVSETNPTTTGNMLGNDSDVDGDTLTITGINGNTNLTNSINTTYGSIIVNENGSYSYTADTSNTAVLGLNDGETLTDTITYRVD